jgi:hypothetical protein
MGAGLGTKVLVPLPSERVQDAKCTNVLLASTYSDHCVYDIIGVDTLDQPGVLQQACSCCQFDQNYYSYSTFNPLRKTSVLYCSKVLAWAQLYGRLQRASFRTLDSNLK